MEKIFIIFLASFILFSCKNPFSNEKVEDAPADFAIQNTENGKILLRLKPEVGDKTQTQMRIDLKPSGMMVPMNTNIIADMKMRVAQTTDSGNFYHVDFQRIRMRAKILGMDMKYDSQGENTNIPNEIKDQVEPILSKKIVMVMDTLAKVKSLEFDDKKTNNQSNIDLNALFIPLPEKEVGVGDSWQATQDVQNLENKNLRYTIKSISDDEVLVKVSKADDEDNSKVEGQYLIDRKTGFTQDGVLNIESEENGQGIQLKIVLDSKEESNLTE